MATELTKRLVINALEDPKYKVRTVKGIVRQTSLPDTTVIETLDSLNDQGILVSTSRSRNGQVFYTTRKHYKEFASPIERLSSAFLNRATI